MPRFIDSVVAFAWAHPLSLVAVLLCVILYARVMMAGPREG